MNVCEFSLCLLVFIYTIAQSCSAPPFKQYQCTYSEHKAVYDLYETSSKTDLPDIGLPISWMEKKRKYADCFQKGLKRIPQELRSDVEIMNLAQNSIARVWKNDFAAYTALVAISLADNCLAFEAAGESIRKCRNFFTIEIGAFYNLNNLTYLAIDGNVMKELPEMLPKSLRILFASLSSLGPIKKHHILHLTSLEIVNFHANCIGGDLKHFCRGNFSIDGPVFSLTDLKYLDISYNNFTRVPNYLFQQSLLGIKLSGNPIHRLESQDFLNSPNTTYLNLAWTSQYIRQSLHIDKGALSSLKNLQTLHLSGNMISNLPENFLRNNSKLKYLNLGFNCLKFVEANPKYLPELPHLEGLYLAGNSFCTSTLAPIKNTTTKLLLSKRYLQFPNLTTLAIGMTSDIPNGTFNAAYFKYNFIYGTMYDRVESDSFAVLKKLPYFKTLAITTSGIRVLDTSAFSGLNLTYLDLSYNHMGELASNGSTSNYQETSEERAIEKRFTQADYANEIFGHQVTLSRSLKTSQYCLSDCIISEKAVILRKNAISNLQLCSLKHFHFAICLDLSYNQISYVKANAFQGLSDLKSLDLRFNPLRQIHPFTMMPLTQLTELKINISECHGAMSLKYLSSLTNDLTLIHADKGYNIYRLLQHYDNQGLSFTKVRSIDVSGIYVPMYYISNNLSLFKTMPNLIALKMNGARFTFRPQSNIFTGIPKLENLSMSNCWLEDFPHDALIALHNLSYLDLSYNKIEVLNKTDIPNLPNLKTLILSYNFIHAITPGTLQSLQANGLANIDLRFNQIRNIGPTIIDRTVLGSISRLDLRGNPIHCECSVSETFGWLVYSSKEPGDVSKIPGFLPDCSYSMINYNGGCLACSNVNSAELLSLFTYSVTQNCQEKFLETLVILFIVSIAIILMVSLTCTNTVVREKIIDSFLQGVRLQHLSETEDKEETPPPLYVYDGFIYYDKRDTTVGDWVDTVLVPRLENDDHQFHVGVVGRDDWCGSTQVQQVLLKMKASRKTIVIISNNFLSSPQCQYVLSVLEQWTYEFKRKSCIILSYGDETCPSEIVQRGRQRNPYTMLRYSTASENCLFWSLLTHAMTLPST